jgi:hypothetical protein
MNGRVARENRKILTTVGLNKQEVDKVLAWKGPDVQGWTYEQKLAVGARQKRQWAKRRGLKAMRAHTISVSNGGKPTTSPRARANRAARDTAMLSGLSGGIY